MNMGKTTAIQIVTMCCFLLIGSTLLVTKTHAVELSKGNVTKVGGEKLCGLFKNKWRPNERVAGKNREYDQVADTKAHRRACSSLFSLCS
jgi:hypothetical protein